MKDKLKQIVNKINTEDMPLRLLEEREEKENKFLGNFVFVILFLLILILLVYIGINNSNSTKQNQKYAKEVKSTLNSGPIQNMLKEKEKINFKGVEITKIATYDITGIVIGMEFFYFGGGANKISNQDLAVCWGPASSEKYINEITTIYGANDRTAFFRFGENYYDKYKQKSGNYVSNNHIIPINKSVKNELKKVRDGDTVQILGWLVYCQGKNWHWGPSSLVRTDKGCEIILTKYLKIVE